MSFEEVMDEELVAFIVIGSLFIGIFVFMFACLISFVTAFAGSTDFTLFGVPIFVEWLLLSAFIGMEVSYWIMPREVFISDSGSRIERVLGGKIWALAFFLIAFFWVVVLSIVVSFFESALVVAGIIVGIVVWYKFNALRVPNLKPKKKELKDDG